MATKSPAPQQQQGGSSAPQQQQGQSTPSQQQQGQTPVIRDWASI